MVDVPLGENVVLLKDIDSLDVQYFMQHVAFGSIVLFDMLLWSDDFKRLVVSEYCKYHIAYLM